jgi:hypothetical protein
MIITRQEGYFKIVSSDVTFEITETKKGIIFKGISKNEDCLLVLPEDRLLTLTNLEYPDLDKFMVVGVISYYKLKKLYDESK